MVCPAVGDCDSRVRFPASPDLNMGLFRVSSPAAPQDTEPVSAGVQ